MRKRNTQTDAQAGLIEQLAHNNKYTRRKQSKTQTNRQRKINKPTDR